MDLLTSKIKSLYFKYLTAAFGSALISSIYGAVDMAMVGQYHGPDGTAALAVIAPIWNIIYSLGLLMGIGGSVIFSTLRGKSAENYRESNQFFTAALIGSVVLGVISWLGIVFFEDALLLLFGADEALLPLANSYLRPIKFVFPVFLFTQMLAAFLRNDNAPGLATKAVLSGGIFNVFGDYFFVFTLDMGIFGAGLATAVGACVSLIIMLTHFPSRKNTLKIEMPANLFSKLGRISVTGFSTFFIDVAMGILTMLFNRQIMKYLGTDALSVYGIIINISTFVQCCAYSIGQAAQPIISTNFGARKGERIREVLKYTLVTAAFFSIVWTALAVCVPNVFVQIFMSPTDRILEIAPDIIRVYAISFLLLPLNIYSTYYFQALIKPVTSFVVSVSRGALISGVLIMTLPMIKPSAIWYAMPLTEFWVAVYVVIMIRRYTKQLPQEQAEQECPVTNRIITISREFSSGGRELGRRLAELLGIAYYDKEIIFEIAARTELSEKYIESIIEKKPNNSFPIHIGRTFQTMADPGLAQEQKVYQEHCHILHELAGRSDCVIVGRCADYILRENNPLRIFVYSDTQTKLRRCREHEKEHEHLSDDKLCRLIAGIDKQRAEYYELHTGQPWGERLNYDFCINTEKIPIKEVSKIICDMIKLMSIDQIIFRQL